MLKSSQLIPPTLSSISYHLAPVSLFDQTLLLAQGSTMYRGPTSQVAPYFSQLGHSCPQHTNPADFVMSLVSTDFSSSHQREDVDISCTDDRDSSAILAERGDVEAFASQFQQRDTTVQYPRAVGIRESNHNSCSLGSSKSQTLRIFWFKTWILLYRNWLNYSRNLMAYGVRGGMYVGLGILLATVWVNLKQDSQHLNDRLSVHFFSGEYSEKAKTFEHQDSEFLDDTCSFSVLLCLRILLQHSRFPRFHVCRCHSFVLGRKSCLHEGAKEWLVWSRCLHISSGESYISRNLSSSSRKALELRDLCHWRLANWFATHLAPALRQTLITLPFLFLCSVLFTVICYWSIGLNSGPSQFFKFLAFLFLAIVAAEYQTLLIASIIPIFIAALAIAAFSFGFLMVSHRSSSFEKREVPYVECSASPCLRLFTLLNLLLQAVQGYFMRNLPAWVYYWAHFIDFQTFAFQILVKNVSNRFVRTHLRIDSPFSSKQRLTLPFFIPTFHDHPGLGWANLSLFWIHCRQQLPMRFSIFAHLSRSLCSQRRRRHSRSGVRRCLDHSLRFLDRRHHLRLQTSILLCLETQEMKSWDRAVSFAYPCSEISSFDLYFSHSQYILPYLVIPSN